MKNIITLILAIALISCSSDDDNYNDDNTPVFEPVHVEFTTIGKGTTGVFGNISASNLFITNENDWINLLNQVSTNGSVSLDFFSTTDVDFNTSYVVAVFLDIKPNRWLVEITEIIECESSIVVSIYDFPQIGDAITQPFHIVKIPNTDKPIVFE